MSALNPIDNPEAFDHIIVGGVESPGLADVSGAALINVFDKKRGKGVKGATLTYTGEEPSDFKVTLRFWLTEHFAAWDEFRPLLKYDPTKKSIKAIDIYHPALEDVGISSVVCSHIGQLEKIETGYFKVDLEFTQFKKPGKSNATGTPSQSTTGTGGAGGAPGTTQPSAQDAQQAEIAALLKKAQEP